MNKPGYVIARNRRGDGYFTTTSAYDRPKWIAVSEATVYYTPEMAQTAAVKLAKNGAYECVVMPVNEAIAMSMPDEDQLGDQPGMDVDFSMSGDGESEMTAQDQRAPCDQCEHCPCTCDPDTDGVDDYVDAELTDEVPDEFADDRDMSGAGEELATRLRMGESATMPAKPPLDAKSSDNADTVLDVKKPDVIKFKQPAEDTSDEDTKLTNHTAKPHDEKVKVPANVMSDLKQVIDKFAAEGKRKDAKDDTRASFCMTVASAFEQLQQYLEQGTVEGLKLAQVHLTSLMSPISTNLPTSVHKYIAMGGRKPSLKDLFDERKEERKLNETIRMNAPPSDPSDFTVRVGDQTFNCTYDGKYYRAGARRSSTKQGLIDMLKGQQNKKRDVVSEATNHMGDRTQSTYAGWKRAVKARHPNVWFEGDQDICNAFVGPKPYVRGETRGVGEWDGSEGSVYK